MKRSANLILIAIITLMLAFAGCGGGGGGEGDAGDEQIYNAIGLWQITPTYEGDESDPCYQFLVLVMGENLDQNNQVEITENEDGSYIITLLGQEIEATRDGNTFTYNKLFEGIGTIFGSFKMTSDSGFNGTFSILTQEDPPTSCEYNIAGQRIDA